MDSASKPIIQASLPNTLQTFLLPSPIQLPSLNISPFLSTLLLSQCLSFPSQYSFLPSQRSFLSFLNTPASFSLPPLRSTEFLPLEHASVKGIEEKVFSEQQLLEGYTHKQAQDCYIHASCSLPTYGSVFFPCKVCPSSCVNLITSSCSTS